MTLVLQHKQLNIAKINCQQVSLTTMGKKNGCAYVICIYTRHLPRFALVIARVTGIWK